MGHAQDGLSRRQASRRLLRLFANQEHAGRTDSRTRAAPGGFGRGHQVPDRAPRRRAETPAEVPAQARTQGGPASSQGSRRRRASGRTGRGAGLAAPRLLSRKWLKNFFEEREDRWLKNKDRRAGLLPERLAAKAGRAGKADKAGRAARARASGNSSAKRKSAGSVWTVWTLLTSRRWKCSSPSCRTAARFFRGA